MTDTLIAPQITEPETETDEPIFSHIVGVVGGASAEAIILKARINGTPVTAICGYVWVPTRDPMKHPVCPRCKEIMENMP